MGKTSPTIWQSGWLGTATCLAMPLSNLFGKGKGHFWESKPITFGKWKAFQAYVFAHGFHRVGAIFSTLSQPFHCKHTIIFLTDFHPTTTNLIHHLLSGVSKGSDKPRKFCGKFVVDFRQPVLPQLVLGKWLFFVFIPFAKCRNSTIVHTSSHVTNLVKSFVKFEHLNGDLTGPWTQ